MNVSCRTSIGRRIVPRKPSWFWIAVLLSVCISQCSSDLLSDGAFDLIDTNHDGTISQEEFHEGALKLESALQGPVPEKLASSWSWSAMMPAAASWTSAGFWKGFSSGVMMIIATEIGDKTFFIAAVLSMRHDRSAVFGGAIVALVIMTVLSSVMGLVLPSVLPKQYTHFLGGALFLYFGIKLIYESRQMESNKVSEELEEVEEELMHPSKKKVEGSGDGGDPENGTSATTASSTSAGNSMKRGGGSGGGGGSLMLRNWYQIFLQSLSLTFLAEWGDRSQIATIALASHKNPYGVTFGGCLGHCLCTGLAVLGGRMLAARISEKTVAFWGGCIFLVFGFHSLFLEE